MSSYGGRVGVCEWKWVESRLHETIFHTSGLEYYVPVSRANQELDGIKFKPELAHTKLVNVNKALHL